MKLRGETVIVTGGSGGIGASFAKQLASEGAVVVVVARNADRLADLVREIHSTHPEARVEVLSLDLTDPAAGEQLQRHVDSLSLDVFGLVNNAGAGANGSFQEIGLQRSLDQVDLDVRAVVELTARFLPGMTARRSGFIINVGSTSGYQPDPGMAVYGAAKAFIRSFNDALWFEVRSAGVRVVGVAPGGVETGFFAAAGKEFLTKGRLTPDEVAAFALARLDGTGPMGAIGLRNRLGTLGSRFAPRRILIAVAARIIAPQQTPAPQKADATTSPS